MKRKVCKIYVFRHGRTFYNVRGLFTGHKHTRLVWRGKRDAKKIARKLKKKEINVAVYTSLPRSKETLNYVLKFHPECKKVFVDDRMIERSYGILEGTTHKQFIKRIGKQLVELKVEGDAIENLKPGFRDKLEKFLGEKEYDAIHRGYDVAVPGGESFADVEKRVGNFIQWLIKYVKKNKVNVAISGHGNSIRLFRKIMERVSKKEAISWFIPYDKIFEYDVKV